MPVKIIRKSPATEPHWPKASHNRHNDWPLASARVLHPANDNQTAPKLEKLYSLLEVAAQWNISLSTLYREIKDGSLLAKKVRGQWRISESAASAYSQARKASLLLPGHLRSDRQSP